VGDRVEFDPVEEPHSYDSVEAGPKKGIGVIHEILPRQTALVRPPSKRRGQPQIVAANIHQIVVVSAIKQPPYKTGLIDRYLVIAHRAGIVPALCMNKIDLANAKERDKADRDLRPYQNLGLPIVFTNAVNGEGIEALQNLLKDKRSVLVGHSGVGKSKLAGRLQPGLTLPSSEVTRQGKGRHTTSASTLFSLDAGGELVDTPGVRELSISDLDQSELGAHFADFVPFLGNCRFTSCSHIPEPGCAVQEGVKSGKISRARYDSYVRLYHELQHHHEAG
jgi:ribosome biogenesis GTPase